MVGELLGKRAMGFVGLGHDQQAARVLVEAMDDAGPGHAADARQAWPAMGDERIDEGAVDIARARMHDEPRRLVDDDEGIVLIDDIERHRLRFAAWRSRRRRHGQLEAVARFDRVFHVLYGRARRAPRGLA